MNISEILGLAMGVIGTGCWGVCFFWMHRISTRQDALLSELSAMAKRIERISRDEHTLMKELHPAVGEIKTSVRQVADAVDARNS